MNFKKRVNGSWVNTPNYIHKTNTDTITTLPAVIHPTGTTATVGLKGNATQNGTPTPSNPVEVNGVGVRTENLAYDILVQDLQPVYSVVLLFSADLEPDTTYTLSFDSISGFYFYINETVFNVKYINTVTGRNQVICTTKSTIDKSDNRQYLNGRWIILKNAMKQPTNIDITNVMLNSGSTAKTYEPYGYKIPILNNSQTTNVYLGETQTTRKIKKLVLTGNETLVIPNTNQPRVPIGIGLQQYGVVNNHTLVSCTHFIVNNSSEDTITSENDFTTRLAESGFTEWFFLPKSFFSGEISVSNCRSQFAELLATQYAAGTPVTIWYVLETEETGIVNEPLMKIGDYADTLSNVSIPVTAGGDTLSAGTTVQPSEVTVNYKGWHDASVHERTNGAWT